MIPTEQFARFPRPLVTLFGRADLLGRIRALLLERVPLLTLTGTAGVGKTALALQVAFDVWQTFADGAIVIDLAPLQAPDLVVQAVLAGIGGREAPGVDPLRRL